MSVKLRWYGLLKATLETTTKGIVMTKNFFDKSNDYYLFH